MRAFRFAVLLGLASVAGCGGPGAPAQPVAAVPVELTEARYADLDAAVRARKGNVVLVDFWATWCGPCRQAFPHFVDLHKKYADKGLACVSVSLDPPGGGDKYDREKVLGFLKDQEATFPNFVLLGYRDSEGPVAARFGLDASIPHQALFGKDGKRVWHRAEKELTDAELDKLIERELAK